MYICDARLLPAFALWLATTKNLEALTSASYFAQIERLDFWVSDSYRLSHRLNILVPIHVWRVLAAQEQLVL